MILKHEELASNKSSLVGQDNDKCLRIMKYVMESRSEIKYRTRLICMMG